MITRIQLNILSLGNKAGSWRLVVAAASLVLLLSVPVFAAQARGAARPAAGVCKGIGERFNGEVLEYKVGFWIFDGVARGRLSFQKRGGVYEGVLQAGTTGLAAAVRSRSDTFVARMEEAPGGGRLRTLSFDKVSRLGGKERRKLVEVDYAKGLIKWTKWKNGKLRKSGEHHIPEGVVYDDPITAFYNLRCGAYGSVSGDEAFTVKTFPSDEGKDIDMTVRFLSPEEAGKRRGRSRSQEGFIADVMLDKELFDSKSGKMEIYFDPQMVVTYVVAKDVLLFGDVRGELIPAKGLK